MGEFISGGSSLKDTDFSNDTDLSGIEDDQSMFLVTVVLKKAFFFFSFLVTANGRARNKPSKRKKMVLNGRRRSRK